MSRKWDLEHPEERKAIRDRYRKAHPDRVSKSQRNYIINNPEKVKSSSKKFRESHPDHFDQWKEKNLDHFLNYQREYHKTRRPNKVRDSIRRKYGVTLEQRDAFLSKQNNRCPICDMVFASTCKLDKPHIDHDHITGKVRGLLCSKCNMAIGLLQDNPVSMMNAYNYLMRSISEDRRVNENIRQ